MFSRFELKILRRFVFNCQWSPQRACVAAKYQALSEQYARGNKVNNISVYMSFIGPIRLQCTSMPWWVLHTVLLRQVQSKEILTRDMCLQDLYFRLPRVSHAFHLLYPKGERGGAFSRLRKLSALRQAMVDLKPSKGGGE